MLKGVLSVAVAIVAVLAFWLLSFRVPDGIADPGYLMILQASASLLQKTGFVVEKLGIASDLNFTRAASEWGFSDVILDPRVTISDDTFDGVRVKVYQPKSRTNGKRQAVVFYHGGGFVSLSTSCYHGFSSYLSAELDWVLISVEYRMAPENPFPIPFEDCLKATIHFMKNSDKYNVDSNRIAVAGDSAGGNLATTVALALSEITDIPKIRFQALFYPVIQSYDFRLPSYIMNNDATPFILSQRIMAGFWSMYFDGTINNIDGFINNRHVSAKMASSNLGMSVKPELIPPEFLTELPSEKKKSVKVDDDLSVRFLPFLRNKFFNPLAADSLSGVAPAYIFTAGFDVLRDEGILYAKRLSDSGVAVEHKHYKSAYHGCLAFIGMPRESEIAQIIMTDFIQWALQR